MLQIILPHILLFLASSSSSPISLLTMLLCIAGTLLIVIFLPSTGLPSPSISNRTMLGIVTKCLPAHQNPNIATPTTARSFIVIFDSKTCLIPSNPAYLQQVIADLPPVIQSIFTLVGCIHVHRIKHGNAYHLYLPILLAYKNAFLQIYFLHVHCLHATIIIHDNTYQIQLTVFHVTPP